MLRYGLICAMCCLLVGSFAFADTKVVVTKDPRREIIGEVTQTPEGIEVRTSMGVIKVPRHNVVSITDYVAPAQQYSQRLANLAADDVDGHIDLGRWAMDNGMLDAAKERFNHVLELQPDNQEAVLRLRQVEARIKRQEEGETEQVRQVTTGDGEEADGAFKAEWLVSMEDVYRIRMAELREDEQVNVQFVNNVLDRFEKAMTGREDADGRTFNARRFRRLRPPDKLIYILANIGRDDTDIRDDIHILTDPEFMTRFVSMWRTLKPTCAASQCHGGVGAPGGLKLLRSPSAGIADDVGRRTFYTNFMILDTYRAQSAEHKGQRLINRDRPEKSLLLQFGLPTDQAVFAHPEVGGEPIEPLFTNAEDRQYENMLKWITHSLRGPVHPYYNVDFAIPLPEPTEEQPPEEQPTEEQPTEEQPAEPPADEDTDG